MAMIPLQAKVKTFFKFCRSYRSKFIILFLIISSNLLVPINVSTTTKDNPTISSSCCIGIRGNIDGDSFDQIDIADLVFFVNYSFNEGPPPPCIEEADVDGNSMLDISDIVYLVNYMFSDGTAPANCQFITWERTYGGIGIDEGQSVCETYDGGYVVTGRTRSYGEGDYDVYLIKTDENGTIVWEKTFGGTEYDEGSSVCETTDSCYIICGYTNSFGAGSSDLYIIKTDRYGNLIWEKTFGGVDIDEGNQIREISDGNYIVAGRTRSFGAGNYDVYLVKTDPNGNLIWEKTFGGVNEDAGQSFLETSDGQYIITGYTRPGYYYDVYLLKIDNNGTFVWDNTYGGTKDEFGITVNESFDNGYTITGHTRSFGDGSNLVYFIEVDSCGTIVWDTTYGGTGSDFGWTHCKTSDSAYVIIGGTNSFGAGLVDIYLIKINSIGAIEWEKTFGGVEDEKGYFVSEVSDGGLILTGFTKSYGAGLNDIYLIKTDSDGNVY